MSISFHSHANEVLFRTKNGWCQLADMMEKLLQKGTVNLKFYLFTLSHTLLIFLVNLLNLLVIVQL